MTGRPTSYKREFLPEHEVVNTALKGGRLPLKTAHNTVDGDKAYTQISDGSPSAAAAAQERHQAKAKPDLVQRRERAGK